MQTAVSDHKAAGGLNLCLSDRLVQSALTSLVALTVRRKENKCVTDTGQQNKHSLALRVHEEAVL